MIGGIALAIEMGADPVDIGMSYLMLGDKAQALENLQACGMTPSLRTTPLQTTSLLNGSMDIAAGGLWFTQAVTLR